MRRSSVFRLPQLPMLLRLTTANKDAVVIDFNKIRHDVNDEAPEFFDHPSAGVGPSAADGRSTADDSSAAQIRKTALLKKLASH